MLQQLGIITIQEKIFNQSVIYQNQIKQPWEVFVSNPTPSSWIFRKVSPLN